MSARVAWITRAPVKALALQQLEEAELGEGGVEGDRHFYLVGAAGRLISNKDFPAFQLIHASYDREQDVLTLTLTDGRNVTGAVERGEEVETRFHSRPRPARLVLGPWSDALSKLAGEPLRLVEPSTSGVDRGRNGAATLLATASLDTLGQVLGVDRVDGRRFRMNFGVEGLDPHEEDTWIGRRVQVGDAVVIPHGNVGRCVVTTQNPDTAISDLDTLKGLAAYRREVATTEPLPFGVHAAVARPGRVRVGDPVSLL
ncbi:MAG TPA: MOSC domain-containing protein [Gaiellaceae bacterium]|nr:MOSC domain-containing protein [Gaiellaceae bacterium]